MHNNMMANDDGLAGMALVWPWHAYNDFAIWQQWNSFTPPGLGFDSVEQPIMVSISDFQSADVKHPEVASQHAKLSQKRQGKNVEEPCPLARAMYSLIGQVLDSGEEERQQYGRAAEEIWKGNYGMDTFMSPVKKPSHHAKMILERLLVKASRAREIYQKRLFWDDKFADVNFVRSLDERETAVLRRVWMDDVETWMSAEHFHVYTHMVRQARKSKARNSFHTSQAFKEHSFNDMLRRDCTSETFFMVFVRHPFLHCVDRMLTILRALSEMHEPMQIQTTIIMPLHDDHYD